jgi:hypothetical protein
VSAEDTHNKIIEAMIEYIKWHERFEYRVSEEAGIKARVALNDVRLLIKQRREEIQEKRDQRRQSRKGMKGRPPKITK